MLEPLSLDQSRTFIAAAAAPGSFSATTYRKDSPPGPVGRELLARPVSS